MWLVVRMAGYAALPAQGCPARADFGHGHHTAVGALASCAAPSERVLRGGAPTAAGLACLKEQGVTAVIDLRTAGEARGARERAQALGLGYQRFPMVNHGDGAAGNARAVGQALAAIEAALASSPTAKVYVHCARGEDRTGLVVAALRLRKQGCAAPVVRREMIAHGYFPYPPLEAVWNDLTRSAAR
jgi:hypothetical protein